MKPTILSAVLSVVFLANAAGASAPDRSGAVGSAEVPADVPTGADQSTLPGGGTCGIVGMESCVDHGGVCGMMCIPLDCTTCGNIEPRHQFGTPPTLVLDLGTCGCSSASVAVSCAPNAYGGTASVACTTSGAEVTFSEALPDRSCCTLTYTGDIVGVRTLVMAPGDVNRDCAVSSADASSVNQRLGSPTAAPRAGAQYDYNRDCGISSADHSSVKSRLGRTTTSCPCP